MKREWICCGALALWLANCSGGSEPASAKRDGQRFLRCAAVYDDGVKELFQLPPLTLERNGYDLEVRGLSRGVVALGLLAGVSEPTPSTLSNLSALLGQLREAQVQALLLAGGLGRTENDTAAILERLAQAPIPILIVPGTEESLEGFRAAAAKVRQRAPQIVDMTRVRRVRIGGVSVISLPGYYKPFYLEARDRGCSYQPSDLDEVAGLMDGGGTPLLLAATPPRGSGPSAVDRGRGGVNIGDPALAEMLGRKKVLFGAFGHVYEAGGQASANDGKTAVVPGLWSNSLFVQAGAAESVPITLANGGRAAGMAQVIEISGTRARYRTLTVNAAQPKEPAAASAETIPAAGQ